MKIVFVDTMGLRYRLDSLDTEPLGGSQSAMLIVAQELVRKGAEVFVAARYLQHGGTWHGVTGLNMPRLRKNGFPQVDAVVTVNQLLPRELVRSLFPRPPWLVHWHKNDARSPYARQFADRSFFEHIDHFVFCSHTQAEAFHELYEVERPRARIIANPLAPAFCRLFGDGEPILPAKDPELMVYASAPNRGLEELASTIFPALRRKRPQLRLEVFSGFYIDQGQSYAKAAADRTDYYRQPA